MAESSYISITDDFKARKIYERMQFYIRDSSNKEEVEILKSIADNKNHQWREETYKFKGINSEVKLTFYSFPSEMPQKELPLHTLEIAIFGEEETRKSSKDKLEEITGISID